MRPIPAHSTDLLYKGNFREEDMVALGHALGVDDIKIITTATLTPERLLYHACLNGVQTYIKLSHLDEAGRAREIADITDALYETLKAPYLARLQETEPQLLAKEHLSSEFCSRIDAVESKKPWDAYRFSNSWDINNYPSRWQKKAIETYRTIRSRIESGKYVLRPDESICDLVSQWSRMNMQYKHYRDAARNLIEDHIQQAFPPERLLTMRPAHERRTTMFLGGMGSGKSILSKDFIDQLPEAERNDITLHNADCLKYALYRSAKKEGVLPADHIYRGAEIQAESSNALYEATRKRGFLARQKFHAPNVVLNSIVLGSFEVLEGIASGGNIDAHHIYISPADAVAEAEKRASVEGRTLSPEDVHWSTEASAKSLMLLTDPAYKKTNIIIHLYQRYAGKAPSHYGSIDAAKGVLHVHDLVALAELSSAIFPQKSKSQSLQLLLAEYTKAGFAVTLAQESANIPIVTLDANRHLTIEQPVLLDQYGALKEAFQQAAVSRKFGKISPAFAGKPEGALHAGR